MNPDPFGFNLSEVEQYHKAVLIAVDALLQQEMLRVMSPSTTGSVDAGFAGRGRRHYAKHLLL